MDQLSSFLHLEVSKYKDINHILKKLEDDGEIKNVFGVFKNIFDTEFGFTLQELIKIQNVKKGSLNLRRQCENNLNLFKNNLLLIVDLIVERALKNTMSENKDKFTNVQEANNTYSEDQIDSATTAATVTSSKLRRNEQNPARARSPRSASREKMLNLSLETKPIVTVPNDKKTASSKLSLSKADSPISAMSGKNFFSVQRDKEAPSSRRNKEILSVSHRISSPTRTDDAHQPRSAVAHARSFVQSEFNHIKGSVRFSKSPRGHEVFEESPGPGAYDSGRYSQKHSPRVAIGKSPKVCWFDVVARNDSPGPHLYPSHHFSSKGKNS